MTLNQFCQNENYSNLKYRIRDSLIIYEKDKSLKIYSTVDRRTLEYEVFDFVPNLIRLLNGENSVSKITKALDYFSEFSAENFDSVMEQLIEDRLIIENGENVDINDRYIRQISLFDELQASFCKKKVSGSGMQNKLNNSTITIIGIGGLGTWVAAALTSSGIGKIKIFDPDIIELSNLNRQILYNKKDIGKCKIDVAQNSLNSINENVLIEVNSILLDNENKIEEYCCDSDVIINCADYPDVMTISDLVATVCEKKNIPHIVGGGYAGNIGIPGFSVIPNKTISWGELRASKQNENNDYKIIKGSNQKKGSVSSVAGILGNMVAWEATKILLGLPLGLANNFKELDLMTFEWRETTI